MPPMPTSPPQVNAFVLCDQAFQQAFTGKWCVIGTFGVIWAHQFPVTHAPLVVFVGLSDFPGGCTVGVSLRDSAGNQIALPVQGPDGNQITQIRVNVPQLPTNVAEFAVPFPPVTFDTAGSYTLELTAGDELLAVRSFRVDKAPPPPKPGEQPPPMPGFQSPE